MLKKIMSGLCVELVCLEILKNFVVEPFKAVFQKVSGSKNVHG